MGHGKLKKFAENRTFACLLQPASEEVLVKNSTETTSEKAAGKTSLKLKNHPVRGHWRDKMFHGRPYPIVLELGCGKGEYSIALAERNADMNYIGVDIKGARLWKGAKYATENHLSNVAFLRTRIEFIEAFFAPDEVSEIWLTFSDPQMKSENCRLTGPMFLERYRKILRTGGIVHLKTDSTFLYEYTKSVCTANNLTVLASTPDLYGESKDTLLSSEFSSVCGQAAVDALFEVQTFYEKTFLKQGFHISYMAFRIDHDGMYEYPDFDAASWRASEAPRFLPGSIGVMSL